MFVVSNVRQWVADIEELNSTKLEYAIMADPTCSILRKVLFAPRLLVTSKRHQPPCNLEFYCPVWLRAREGQKMEGGIEWGVLNRP